MFAIGRDKLFCDQEPIETPLVHNLLSKAKWRKEKGRGVDKNI